MKSAYLVHPFYDRQDKAEPWKCRILFIVGQLGAGGLEQQICYLLKGMDRQLYLPALVVWNYRESDVHVADVKELDVPTWGFPLAMSSYRKLYELTHLTRGLSPELVHSYTFFTNFAASWVARTTGCIAIGSIRNELDLDLSNRRPLLGRLSAAFPKFQISNSHAAATKAVNSGKHFKAKRVMVVQNGLDLERFRLNPIPTNPPYVILGIGSLVSSKRWDRVLLLARDLKLQGVDCLTQIAGEGPLRPELESLAFQYGITDRMRFLGYRSDIADLIAKARLVVHSSDGEGSPNAIMEALACGRPVVATNVGDVARLIRDGKNGYIVPRDDSDALLKRVSEILSDDEIARRMGESALEYARQDFALPEFVHKTFEAYRSAGWKFLK